MLAREVDAYLGAAADPPDGTVTALIAPHAGLVYSGPVAGYAYRAVRGRAFEAVTLVGPSHFIGFEGVAVHERGAFEMPFGDVPVAADLAEAIMTASEIVRPYPAAHSREHSLEMQLPFLWRVQPGAPILPLVVGYQTRETILALADALATALDGRNVLLVASTDLSHYFAASTAARLDGRIVGCIERFDPEELLREFERYPEHERGRYVACGGGPAIAVMRAARRLGAREAVVLRYADSGDVSGDKGAVVGYVAAAFGTFAPK